MLFITKPQKSSFPHVPLIRTIRVEDIQVHPPEGVDIDITRRSCSMGMRLTEVYNIITHHKLILYTSTNVLLEEE